MYDFIDVKHYMRCAIISSGSLHNTSMEISCIYIVILQLRIVQCNRPKHGTTFKGSNTNSGFCSLIRLLLLFDNNPRFEKQPALLYKIINHESPVILVPSGMIVIGKNWELLGIPSNHCKLIS